jgi:ribose transport system ATP-binding protein
MTVAETTPAAVVSAMVGRVMDELYPPKQRPEDRTDEVILEVRGLNEPPRFLDISFTVRQGEIVGLGGLIGAGRSEIVKGICRLGGEVTGEVRLAGRLLALGNYSDSIAEGLVYLSEDRKGDGLFLDMSIFANVSALRLRQVASAAGIIDHGREAAQAQRLAGRLNLKYGDIGQPVSALSGGNQQKVAIARMLSVDPKVVFLDEPTRGVDVGAKAEIHRILRDLANRGVGVVVISSELPELIGICDRILVVREGQIAGEVAGEEMTEDRIIYLASVGSEQQQVA